MKILDLLKIESIDIDAKCENKDAAIQHLVSLMEKQGNLTDVEAYKQAIYAREELSTTGIGEGIAIPHAQSEVVKEAKLATMVVKDGVDYQSLDQQPAQLFFMIAVPQTGGNEHLQILAMLSQMLMDSDFKNSLIQASSCQQFMDLISQKENEQVAKEQEKEELQNQFQGKYRLLAVTACPTGIAHTYMAAEALENKADEMDVTIKIETNGSGGAKNILSAKDIEECEAIIVAADKDVALDRFDGKPVLQVRVADGIHKPEELIKEALSGQVPIYQAEKKTKKEEATKKNEKNTEKPHQRSQILFQLYKHMMNGINHILPFVVGAGIMLSLSILLKNNTVHFKFMSVDTTIPTFLKTVGHAAMQLVFPVLSGYIAMSIADQPGLFVGFVGGMLVNNDNAGFLSALIIGFVAGYFMKWIQKLCNHIPNILEGLKPIFIYPFIGVLFISILTIFVIDPLMLPVHQYVINVIGSMNGWMKFIVGAILGIMMAVDMGGPVNKIAYVIGVASIMNGHYDIMAAVMIAGMVPPIAIGLSTFLFKNCFTESEQKTTVPNIIKGLCFITEGAIPFVSADKKSILPACLIGSGLASGVSMLFECQLRVPHGGIFVVWLVSQPIRYLIALAMGSIAGMVIIGFMKKPIQK